MYETLVQILRTTFGWAWREAPEPTAVEEFLTSVPGATVDSVISRLEEHLSDVSAGKPRPYDFAGTARDYERQRRFVEGQEYWRTNTLVALGLAVEPVVAQGRIARTVAEWWDNQTRGLSYLGYPLLAPDTPAGAAEAEARRQSAERPPIPFVLAGLGALAQFLIREGLLKRGVPAGLGWPAEYLGGKPEAFAGFDAQKVLDNLHAARRTGRVRAKWLEGGTLNPEWKA